MSTIRTVEREADYLAAVDVVYEPLQRYLGRRATPDDASEVLNDTLLVLWRRLDDVPADDPLPWAYGVAKRCLANHRRGDRRRHRLTAKLATGGGGPGAAGMAWTSPADIALDSALQDLDDDSRELVRLWAWERLEPREIAVVLDLPANAVSSRLTRAKRALAASVERHDRRQDRGPAGHGVVGHGKEHRP